MLPVCILAGGLATRMRPMTERRPKAMLPVNGTPFIRLQLEELMRQGVSRVVLCLGYLGEQIERYVQSLGLRLDIEYAYDGAIPLGTGGAIKRALPLLSEHFFVLYGDSWLRLKYSEVQEAWQNSEKKALMTVYKNYGQWDKSNAAYDGVGVVYRKDRPDPSMEYIDYGLGILSAECFASFSGKFDLAQVYETLSKEKELAGWEVADRFYEIGSPDGLQSLEQFLQGDRV